MADQVNTYSLFEVYGVEIEYMIVDKDTLSILPIADKVLGEQSELTFGPISWNNELALHVIEVKTTHPTPTLEGLDLLFLDHIRQITARLEPYNAMLMPGGMHPWMDPTKETHIWPHQWQEIYSSFDRIFNCRSHGWGNLQSSHLNLPFKNDEEFMRLHAAIRAVLPLIPALAASTPFANGADSGFADYRLEVYRSNAEKFPAIAGVVIPEPIYSQKCYVDKIYGPIDAVIKPLDTLDVFEAHWVNSRGAIARFDRGSIEIRLIDSQESPIANFAILQALVEVLKSLCNKEGVALEKLKEFPTERLLAQFLKMVKHGEDVLIDDLDYLALFGIKNPIRANDLWRRLVEECWKKPNLYRDICLQIIEQGTLSKRLRQAKHEQSLATLYRKLSDSLYQNSLFR